MSTQRSKKSWAAIISLIILVGALGFGGGYKWAEAQLPTTDGVWGTWFRDAYLWVSQALHLDYTSAGSVLITNAGKNVTTDAGFIYNAATNTATIGNVTVPGTLDPATVAAYGMSGDIDMNSNDIIDVAWVNSTSSAVTSLYVKDVLGNYQLFNATEIIDYPEQAASYVVWVDGATYYAKNGHTGAVTSNANAVTLIQACMDDADRGSIYLKGTFVIGTPLVISTDTILIGLGQAILDIRTNTDTGIFTNAANNHISFINLKVLGDNDQTGIDISANHVTVVNCRFDSVKYAIRVGGTYCNQVSIHDNWFYGGTIGVWVRSADTVFIKENWFEGMSGVAIQISTVSTIPMINCWVEENIIKNGGGTMFYGAISISCVTTSISELHINRNNIIFTANPANAFNGILLHSETAAAYLLTNSEVKGNIITGNSSYANLDTAIYLHGHTDANIYDNTISENIVYGFDSGIVNVQNSTQFNKINYNIIRNCTTPIIDDGICQIIGNTGYVTESSGTAQINAGATTVVVTHGCNYTPSALDITITPTNSTSAALSYYVGTFTATQFTITVTGAPAAGAPYSWHIIKTP